MEDGFKWQQQATPEEQQEYERVMQAISTALYDDDKTFEAVNQMLQSGEDPVQAVVKATILVITEIDKKIDIPDVVLPQLPSTVFDMILEIGTKAGVLNLTDEQVKAGVSAAQQMLMQVYGLTEEDFAGLSEGLDENDVNELAGIYQDATNGSGFTQKGA